MLDQYFIRTDNWDTILLLHGNFLDGDIVAEWPVSSIGPVPSLADFVAKAEDHAQRV